MPNANKFAREQVRVGTRALARTMWYENRRWLSLGTPPRKLGAGDRLRSHLNPAAQPIIGRDITDQRPDASVRHQI